MKLLLLGDICPTDATRPSFDAGSCEALMGDALKKMRGADVTLANLECALTDGEMRIRKCGLNLKGKPGYARVIKNCGVDYCGLSNNHVMDFGIQGFRDTVKSLTEAGISSFGWGENDQASRAPLFIEGEKKVGIVAVCEHEYSYALPDQMGSNPFDPFDTMQDVKEAKEKCDFLVVMYHGGKEQCQYPSPRLCKACQALVRAGADLVLCQHSHCIGCLEKYQGGEIVYGQGNFNFVKYIDHPHWHSGLMVEVDFKEKTEITYIPVVANTQGIELAKDKEKEEILNGFMERSRILLDDAAWMQEWEDFCQSKKEGYTDNVKNAYQSIPEGDEYAQAFPHYLDCEAHLDVWKTLYQTWHPRKKTGA